MLISGNEVVLAILPVLPVAQTLLVIVTLFALSFLTMVSLLFRPRLWKQAAILAWRQKLGLLVLVFLLAAGLIGVFGARRLLRAYSVLPVPAAPRLDDWPNRGNAANTGSWPDETGPDQPGIIWSAEQTQVFYSSPALTGNRVYCVGNRGARGRFYCWNIDTGEILWTTSPDQFRGAFSSPVISSSRLYCGEGFHDTSDARLFCLDLSPGHEGEVLWTYQTRGHIECTPVVSGDRVYFNAGDDGIYCLKTNLNLSAEERLVWHHRGDAWPDAETTLVVHDDKVYAGLGVGGNLLSVLDALTGEEISRISFPYPVFSTPAVSENRMYLGCGNGDLLNSSLSPGGQVACIDLQTNDIVWTSDTPDAVMGALVISGHDLYCPTADGTLLSLSLDGQIRQKWSANARLVSSPAVTTDAVYLVTGDGTLTALERTSLVPLWQQRLGPPGIYVSSPVIADGSLFLGTPENGFLRLGTPLHSPQDVYACVNQPGLTNSDFSALPAQAELKWMLSLDALGIEADHLLPVAVADEHLVTLSRHEGRSTLQIILHPGTESQQLISSIPLQDNSFPKVAIRERKLFISSENSLSAVDLQSGKTHWTRTLEQGGGDGLCVTRDSLLVDDGSHRLLRISHDNSLLWSTETGQIEHSVQADRGMIAVLVQNPPSLKLLDLGTGRLLWSTTLSAEPASAPRFMNDRIIVATTRTIESRSIIDGHEFWKVPLPEDQHDSTHSRSFSIAPQSLYVWSTLNRAAEFDLQTGHKQPQQVLPEVTAEILPGRNQLLTFNSNKILATSRLQGQGSSTDWYLFAADEQWTGTPLLFSGHVYVSIEGQGIACLGAGEIHD